MSNAVAGYKSKTGKKDAAMQQDNLLAVASVLHQLAQPLTVLHGLIELSLLENQSADQYRECLKQALTESERLVGYLSDARQAIRVVQRATEC
jgi:signal transduction histidine kinase